MHTYSEWTLRAKLIFVIQTFFPYLPSRIEKNIIGKIFALTKIKMYKGFNEKMNDGLATTLINNINNK